MTVYALVGKSGTGKSHHSMWVAREYGMDHIVDDGLLIAENRIIAGKSAKREPNKVASVRCAIFSDPNHSAAVRQALKERQAERLLLIGTSEKMVRRIAEELQVAPIDKIIRIEDVATEEEIRIAQLMRNEQGKHVIPVPTFELKKQFSGYFIDPLMVLFKKKGQTIMEEKTVMRPAYSYLGEFKISHKAIADICTYEAMRFAGVYKVIRVKNTVTPDGQFMLDVDAVFHFPCRVSEEAERVSRRIKESVETFAGVTVRWVHINVKDLHL